MRVPASRGARRRHLVDLMREKNLSFEDPPRDNDLESLAQITEGFVGADSKRSAGRPGCLPCGMAQRW